MWIQHSELSVKLISSQNKSAYNIKHIYTLNTLMSGHVKHQPK